MSLAVELECPSATDGEIATINLESAHRQAWARFGVDPRRPGLAEAIVDNERLVLQFLGDLDALDRLEVLAEQFAQADNSFRSELLRAEVASAGHRFGDARSHLTRAAQLGGPSEAIERQRLTINHACGVGLDDVLTARRRIAASSSQPEDLVPIGATLADLERFTEADTAYRQAFYSYRGLSPFALAWVCFQLGMLWGELMPEPNPMVASLWYQRAIEYLPRYVAARVHLAEIYLSQDRAEDAEALLLPACSSRDPEARWRFADVLIANGRIAEATAELETARLGFEGLLDRHPLAFADHAAEFYAGSGDDYRRALKLARTNFANRSTSKAAKQLKAIAANYDRAARRSADATSP